MQIYLRIVLLLMLCSH